MILGFVVIEWLTPHCRRKFMTYFFSGSLSISFWFFASMSNILIIKLKLMIMVMIEKVSTKMRKTNSKTNFTKMFT